MSVIVRTSLRKIFYTCVLGSMTTLAIANDHVKLPASAWVVNDQGMLLNFAPAAPSDIKRSFPIKGLVDEDALIGIDFRVARGDLYGLAESGRIYLIDHNSGKAELVSESGPLAQMAIGPYGFDFNPAADKLRVVGKQNGNLRLDPDNGALVDFDKTTDGVQIDPKLAYDQADQYVGQQPDIVAAAYTYHPQDSSLTTNYAIDRRQGTLVMQGTKEGHVPAVSPNLGVLYSVGSLQLGTLRDASMDISDIDNVALAAISSNDSPETALYRIDLDTGAAHKLGKIGDGEHVTGFAIEP